MEHIPSWEYGAEFGPSTYQHEVKKVKAKFWLTEDTSSRAFGANLDPVITYQHEVYESKARF